MISLPSNYARVRAEVLAECCASFAIHAGRDPDDCRLSNGKSFTDTPGWQDTVHTLALERIKSVQDRANAVNSKPKATDTTLDDVLTLTVRNLLKQQPDLASKYRDGKISVLNVLVGLLLKELKGNVDPSRARLFMEKELSANS